ncbi:sensor domain-containing diguanylate cyclase [Calycomorphotria hydatis]|uniref:diguanylate cyclase n=1 Tax=Calycomorphotria hydatis TaxID=2528027 RepID=A0A517T3L0_9PLAN|nr:sensor domain-containing diguanylate cyclase [Calycomorphotria hydatis]QDT62963.1 Response regulator PleD [Calycomorphotria hydatis]
MFGDVSQVIVSGYVVALSAVVLLQYLFHLYRMSRERRRQLQIREELEGLEGELGEVRREGTLTRLENHILREFVSEANVDRALDVLLRRYVPRLEHGFAALVEKREQGFLCQWSRGLTERSRQQVTLSAAEFQHIQKERAVIRDLNSEQYAQFVGALERNDARKARKLCFIAVGSIQDPVGVFVTTDLYPTGASQQQQEELAHRLMGNVATSLAHTRLLENRELQLRAVSEMLELRTVTDKQFDSPVTMIRDFTESLRKKVGADRASVYLPEADGNMSLRSILRCGPSGTEGVDRIWQTHEDKLARVCQGIDEPKTFEGQTLQNFGIETLIRRAMIFPLKQGDRRIGLICLTKSSPIPFETSARQLADWASDYLGETLLRAVNQASIMRQARQDGLTELANRREFDTQLAAILEQTVRNGGEVSLLLCDLDRFKSINDTYGHQAGDHVLKETARIMREEVMKTRSSDRALIARYGGEEMAILLPGFPLAGAMRVADSIRTSIEQTKFEYDGRQISVTISIGIATAPQHCSTQQDLIAFADAGLYEAKESGRNKVCVSGSREVAEI